MTIVSTGNIDIDALLSGNAWVGSAGTAATVTYSFMTQAPSYATSSDAAGFQPMTAAQQKAAVAAMAAWSAVANVSFVQVSDSGAGGQIRLGTNNQGTSSSGYAYLPDGSAWGGDLYLNNTDSSNSVFTTGSYGPSVLIHELGHALGLKHPGNYSGTETGPFLPTAVDNRDYTDMSYNNGSAWSTLYYFNKGIVYDTTPMMYDILAMQYIYGANLSYRIGNDIYSFTNYNAPTCIWDAGGANTFDFSACTGYVSINLNAGTFSSTSYQTSTTNPAGPANNVSIAFGTLIQNAVAGSGGSQITCNDANDTVTGGAGNDVVVVGKGAEVVDGKGGVNTVQLTSTAHDISADSLANVQVLDLAGQAATLKIAQFAGFSSFLNASAGVVFADAGAITANPAISTYTLAAGTNSFTAVKLASGGYTIAGGAGNDTINLGATTAANTITWSAGNDTIRGGAEHDTVVVAGASSQYTMTALGDGHALTLASAAGTDTISSVSFLQFTDKTEVVATADQANVARLYQAALGRAPDAAGLSAWEDAYASLVPASAKAQGAVYALAEVSGGYNGSASIAAGFTTSAEFTGKYGSLDNPGFATQLYYNVLGRAPDAGGLSDWVGALTAGTWTRDMVLVGFAESPENIAKTAAAWLLAV